MQSALHVCHEATFLMWWWVRAVSRLPCISNQRMLHQRLPCGVWEGAQSKTIMSGTPWSSWNSRPQGRNKHRQTFFVGSAVVVQRLSHVLTLPIRIFWRGKKTVLSFAQGRQVSRLRKEGGTVNYCLIMVIFSMSPTIYFAKISKIFNIIIRPHYAQQWPIIFL